jgi:hypothetical protein
MQSIESCQPPLYYCVLCPQKVMSIHTGLGGQMAHEQGSTERLLSHIIARLEGILMTSLGTTF